MIQKRKMRVTYGSLKMLKEAEMMVIAPLMKRYTLNVYNPTMKNNCGEML
jgi:hypothetical protein